MDSSHTFFEGEDASSLLPATSSSNLSGSDGDSSESSNTAQIVLPILAAAALLLGLIGFWLWRRRRHQHPDADEQLTDAGDAALLTRESSLAPPARPARPPSSRSPRSFHGPYGGSSSRVGSEQSKRGRDWDNPSIAILEPAASTVGPVVGGASTYFQDNSRAFLEGPDNDASRFPGMLSGGHGPSVRDTMLSGQVGGNVQQVRFAPSNRARTESTRAPSTYYADTSEAASHRASSVA